jgi:hypothetical protein
MAGSDSIDAIGFIVRCNKLPMDERLNELLRGFHECARCRHEGAQYLAIAVAEIYADQHRLDELWPFLMDLPLYLPDLNDSPFYGIMNLVTQRVPLREIPNWLVNYATIIDGRFGYRSPPEENVEEAEDQERVYNAWGHAVQIYAAKGQESPLQIAAEEFSELMQERVVDTWSTEPAARILDERGDSRSLDLLTEHRKLHPSDR